MLAYLAVVLAVAIPVPEEPPSVALFADAAWYKDQPAKEQDFAGVLTRFTRTGPIGPRFNAYRLILDGDAPDLREVHVADKADTLAPFVGKRVKVVGKAVETDADGRRLREIWPARLVALDDGPPARPRRANVLGEHKLYAKEPGAEKILDGVLRKEEKGGYVLEMAKVKEELTLYPDAGDSLAPFVGKQVRLGGKQVEGLVGMRTFRHTLPGWLELVDASPPGLDRAALRRQYDRLLKYLEAEHLRRHDLMKLLVQAADTAPERFRQLRQQQTDSDAREVEVATKLAELERQLAQPGPGATREVLERALAEERKRRDAALARFKEIQRVLANITEVATAEFIQARRDEGKVKAEVEQAAQRVRELEEQLARLNRAGAAPADELQNRVELQRDTVRQVALLVDELRLRLDKYNRLLPGVVTPADIAALQTVIQQATARLDLERKRLADLEAQRAKKPE